MNLQPILLVEDDDDDAALTLRAFEQARIGNPIVRARDGMEAMASLLRCEATPGYTPDPLPAVVLLDLKLPRLGGLEVLKEIRGRPQLRFLPVVVLTSSDESRDLRAAYSNHANSYVRKPVDYGEFVRAAQQLGLYWTVHNHALSRETGEEIAPVR
jgi:two-component system response regulator